ncbi:hypothetical protein RRG08_061640 [Elysia crispata]|uniref:Uncharacterized protein n=1 Tax=Elysia crispata TaxID=231223 RepID=A0AAE1A1L2_9GAST|nr:hypothetical protein RRG08_061640 [Elysia crispata]
MAEKVREIFITRKNLTLLSNSNAFAQIGQLFREHHRKFRVLVMSPGAGHNVVRGSIMDAGKPSRTHTDRPIRHQKRDFEMIGEKSKSSC